MSIIKKNDISYTYDSQGRLFAQSNSIEYFYDENSKPIAFKYNGEIHYYKRDLLGSVIEILDTTGTTVVKYTYDAWGNHKVLNPDGTENTSAVFIGNINPIRYRSYYYDTETGLYYLQTRYYDPQVGRFINIDDISYLDPESINGLNLYAYCGNNPVMRVDPDGNAFVSILIAMAIGFGIGAAVGGGIEVGKQIKSNGWNPSNWDWCQIGLSALGGGVAGAISALPISGTGFLSYLGTFITESSDILKTCVFGYFVKAGVENISKIVVSKVFSSETGEDEDTEDYIDDCEDTDEDECEDVEGVSGQG